MKKLYSTLLLVMAMLCLGANSAWAQVTLGQDMKYALGDINNSCEEKGTNFTLTFAFSVQEGLTETNFVIDESEEGKIKLYTDGNGNYVVAPKNSNETIKAPNECSAIFMGLSHLASVNFTNFDTSEVTGMYIMFWGCESLTSLDLSGFNTSKVENMTYMFNYCTNLTSITVGDGWTTEKVTESEDMFGGCPKLRGQNGTAYSADHTNADYARVDGDYGQPGYLSRADGKVKIAESLESDASVFFDVTPDVDAVYTFTASDANATIVIREKGAMAIPAGTGSLTNELAAGDTYTVTIVNNTSAEMTDLTVSISKKVIDYITLTVGETTSVGDIAAGTYPYCHFTPATSGYYTFTANNESVQIIIASGSVYNPNTISQYWGSCDAVLQAGTTYMVVPGNFTEDAMSDVTVTTTKVDFPALTMGENSDITIPACTYGFTTVATFTPTISDTYQFTIDPGDVYIFVYTEGEDFGSRTPGEYEAELEAGKMYAVMTYSNNATTGTITVSRDVPTIDAATWKEALAEINGARVEYSDTYTITFANSYSGSDEGISVGVGVKLYGGEDSNYNYIVAPTKAGDVIMAPADCSELFAGLTNLTAITFDNFNTENVTNMGGMFAACSRLESITFGENFNTSSVVNMSGMFVSCNGLKQLDLSRFNTSSVKNMGGMFNVCTNLQSLTIGNFDMSNVTTTADMFYNCTKLNTLTMKSLPYLLDGTFNTLFSGKTVKVELDDNSVMYVPTNEKPNYLPTPTTAPTYTRTVAATSNYGTLVVPFEVKSNDDVQLYKFASVRNFSVGDDALTFTPVETVAANTPCLFKKKASDATNLTFTANSNATPVVVEMPIADYEVNDAIIQFIGTYEQKKINWIYFIAQDKFWLAEEEITVPPFRAWLDGLISFDIDSGYAKAFTIVVDDEADGIKAVNSEQLTVNNGKFIENGKVVVVKNGKKFNLNGQRVR